MKSNKRRRVPRITTQLTIQEYAEDVIEDIPGILESILPLRGDDEFEEMLLCRLLAPISKRKRELDEAELAIKAAWDRERGKI